MTNGHLPRLARLVAEDRQFLKRIQRLHVDDGHFIYTAGLKHYGLSAFRPALGRLGEFRIKIGKQVPMQALSGTQPPHIKAAIIENLLFDESRLCSVELTSNRPNTIYATHPIVGELRDFRNLDFIVPVPYPTGWQLPKTLVFHDNAEQAGQASLYHTKRLPEDLQKNGLVMHYHGGMSKEYLTRVYEDFSKPDGNCRVLHTTDASRVLCLHCVSPRWLMSVIRDWTSGALRSLSSMGYLGMYRQRSNEVVGVGAARQARQSSSSCTSHG